MSTPERRLLINLRIISAILPHQKLNAKRDLLSVEPPSWLPESLYRWFRGDTREICLRRLEEIISEAIVSVECAGRLNDRKMQNKFLSHINRTIPGFHNIKQTYAYDATTVAKIELFIEQCQDILSTHNYEPDRMVVMNDLPASDDSSSEETDDDEGEEPIPRLGPKKGQEPWRKRETMGTVLN
jgi:hypothetical protein